MGDTDFFCFYYNIHHQEEYAIHRFKIIVCTRMKQTSQQYKAIYIITYIILEIWKYPMSERDKGYDILLARGDDILRATS